MHWGPDFWVSVDVDLKTLGKKHLKNFISLFHPFSFFYRSVKTGDSNSHASKQPQIAIQFQSGDLGLVNSVFNVTILVLVESKSESLGKWILSITTPEFQFVLSLNGQSECSRGVRSEHACLFDFSKKFLEDFFYTNNSIKYKNKIILVFLSIKIKFVKLNKFLNYLGVSL